MDAEYAILINDNDNDNNNADYLAFRMCTMKNLYDIQ